MKIRKKTHIPTQFYFCFYFCFRFCSNLFSFFCIFLCIFRSHFNFYDFWIFCGIYWIHVPLSFWSFQNTISDKSFLRQRSGKKSTEILDEDLFYLWFLSQDFFCFSSKKLYFCASVPITSLSLSHTHTHMHTPPHSDTLPLYLTHTYTDTHSIF